MILEKLWWPKMALILILGLCWAGRALAQTDDEAGAGVIFNFSTPGARSLGMGGAFLGSVDDATAAVSNPAGLLQLSEPEVLVEGRNWRYSVPFPARGRAAGRPSGRGVDTLAFVETEESQADLSGISFASAVYPRRSWAAAIFFHQAAKFESAFETQGVFGNFNRLPPVRARYSLDLRQIGVAFAKEWQNGIAAGVSLAEYSLDLNSLTQRYFLLGNYEPAFFLPGLEQQFNTQEASSSEVGVSLGLRWDISDRTSVGLVVREAPQFDLAIRWESGSPQVPPPNRAVFVETEVIFDIPDLYGFGVSYRPSPNATINFDLNRVMYSQLVQDFVAVVSQVDREAVFVEDYVLEDVTQIHLGAEYVFSQWWAPLALRAGVWHDPDHRLRVVDGPELNRARFGEGEDQLHYSLGLGLIIGSKFQLDAAVDVSDVVETAALSMTVRF